jgi:hypothetical protein
MLTTPGALAERFRLLSTPRHRIARNFRPQGCPELPRPRACVLYTLMAVTPGSGRVRCLCQTL